MSESHSFNLDQFYVYQSIIRQLIDQTFSYFHDPWRYTNYIYDNIVSWKKELIDYQVIDNATVNMQYLISMNSDKCLMMIG